MTSSPELTPVRLAQVTPTTTDAVVYAVPVGQIALVQRLVLANTALAWSAVSVNLVDTNTPGDLSNRILHQVPIPPEGIVTFDLYQPIAGAVAASASPATVTLTVSGSLFAATPGTWDAAPLTWDSVDAGVTWDGYA